MTCRQLAAHRRYLRDFSVAGRRWTAVLSWHSERGDRATAPDACWLLRLGPGAPVNLDVPAAERIVRFAPAGRGSLHADAALPGRRRRDDGGAARPAHGRAPRRARAGRPLRTAGIAMKDRQARRGRPSCRPAAERSRKNRWSGSRAAPGCRRPGAGRRAADDRAVRRAGDRWSRRAGRHAAAGTAAEPPTTDRTSTDHADAGTPTGDADTGAPAATVAPPPELPAASPSTPAPDERRGFKVVVTYKPAVEGRWHATIGVGRAGCDPVFEPADVADWPDALDAVPGVRTPRRPAGPSSSPSGWTACRRRARQRAPARQSRAVARPGGGRCPPRRQG